jgi:hypothetical protein
MLYQNDYQSVWKARCAKASASATPKNEGPHAVGERLLKLSDSFWLARAKIAAAQKGVE